MAEEFGGGDEVVFSRQDRVGIITLDRPAALNALTHRMVLAISRALDAWETDEDVALVVVRGEGRAFCAGGDIQAIYRAGLAGEPLYGFFADEYRLNARIQSYSKPYIALIDGIVMGGGVGISIHGSHRIFTENARFAMPEATIGFFPDVGGSRFLPRLPGQFGLWLGLTGSRLGWGDALWSGLATHCVKSGSLDDLVAAWASGGDIDQALQSVCQSPQQAIDEPTLANIQSFFAAPDLDTLWKDLTSAASAGDRFAVETLKKMSKCSPTSLHVAFRQIRAGGLLSMPECMAMEYRIVNKMLQGHDFYEGIRAAVIDKDASPRWEPDDLTSVKPAAVDAYFANLGSGELILGSSQNEAAPA